MTARLSVHAESPETTGLPETSVDKYDGPFASIVERLQRLPLPYQESTVTRAMCIGDTWREKRTHGEIVSALARAEAPPAAVWRETRRLPHPSQDRIAEAARSLVDCPAWRAAQERSTSRHDRIAAALRDAGIRLVQEWRTAPVWEMEITNQAEYDAGQRHADRWRSTLDALAGILDALDARVPDAWLASISEAGLRAAAETAAQLGLMTTPRASFSTPEARRARCPVHHRRQLRRRAARARQHIAALLGTVGAGAAPYADGYAVGCWKERQEAAKAFGLTREACFADGHKVTLWDLMETSRKARVAGLYAQTLGLDDLAQRRGFIPLFLTMTLPPTFHPNPQYGAPYAGLDWTDALSPEDTDRALIQRWAQFRARLADEGISPLGLRVVEPHRDGCPHLHGLLYAASEDEADLIDRHLLAVCPDPEGRERVASKLIRIDRTRASAASYVMKYLMKALPAHERAAELADGVERDGDPDHLAHHAEVAAWASERRLRRFAWVGLHGLRTVWQRVRKLDDAERITAPESIRTAATMMQAGAWGDALEALGAIRADRAPRPRLTYEEQENGYGEIVRRAVGIALGDWEIPLRRQECEIRPTGKQDARTSTVQDVADPSPLTVTVSCPRACPVDGEQAFPIIRTGPPGSDLGAEEGKIQFA